jgi:hypothetical protein
MVWSWAFEKWCRARGVERERSSAHVVAVGGLGLEDLDGAGEQRVNFIRGIRACQYRA